MAHTSLVPAAPNPNTKWFVVVGLAATISLIFLWPFLGIVCFSAVMAYCFIGPYRWLTRRMKKNSAAFLAMSLSVATVVIPVTVVLLLSIVQCVQLINQLGSLTNSPDNAVSTSVQPVVDTVNHALSGLNNGQPVMSTESVHQFVKETLPQILAAGIKIIIGVVGSIPVLMTSVILYGYLVSAFLKHNEKIRKLLKDLSPFNNRTSDIYLERAGNMIKGSLQGQLLMALILGVSNALLMFIIGLGDYFFFFVIIYTLLSMVPLGTGIIVMPLGILAMLGNQFWQGFWLLVLYLVVVCNLDNFLRPKLIPKKARIVPAILILATFCGLFYFGLIGIVYGPVIAVLVMTTIEAFLEYRGKSNLKSLPVSE